MADDSPAGTGAYEPRPTPTHHHPDSSDRPAIIHGDHVVTRPDLDRRVESTADRLVDAGLGPGSRLAVIDRGSVHTLELALACAAIGSIIVPINVRLSPSEVRDLLEDSGAGAFFLDPSLEHLIPTSRAGLIRIDPTVEIPAPRRAVTHPCAPDDVVVQLYTSGTTGRPKGALITRANLDATIANVTREFALDDSARYLSVLSLFHISGLGTSLAVLAAGGTIVMGTSTSATDLAQDIERHRITHLNLVPTLMVAFAQEHHHLGMDLTSVRHVMFGAAPSGSDTIARCMQRLPSAEFHHGYGLTECTGGIVYETPVCWDRGDRSPPPAGRVGRPVPDASLRIVEPDSGTDQPDGVPGEIWVRSPQNIPGYHERRDASLELYGSNGWLRTGDIGVWDGCHLHLRDRLKELIISGGENISPAEVERVLDEHPAVLASGVYGRPDPYWGETVAAAVVLVPDAVTDEDTLIAHARERLAHFKCPRHIRFVDELPRGATGKILRRQLTETHPE